MATILFKSKKLSKIKETKEELEETNEKELKKKIFNFSILKKKLIFSRISGIRPNYYPDLRPNQYPAQPQFYEVYKHQFNVSDIIG